MSEPESQAGPSLLASMLSGAAAFSASAQEHLGDVALTLDQWRVLDLVVRRPGLTMSGLSSRLSVPSSTTTRIVDHLVNVRAVHRVVDALDRRRVTLHATETGAALTRQAEQALAVLEQTLREGMRREVDPDRPAPDQRLTGHLVVEGARQLRL